MAWTAPRTFVANETVTAAHLNTHVRDNFLETAVAKVTTAGDIVQASGANALARLAIGSKFQQLRVNAGATALEYGPASYHVIKSADESVSSSTTLQNDDELLLPVGTNETWVVEAFLRLTVASNGISLTMDWTAPAGATGTWRPVGGSEASASDPFESNGAGLSSTFGGFSIVTSGALVMAAAFVATAGTAGNIQLRWAQFNSSATALVMKAGSMLRCTRVA